jgi:hypothetical protein
MRLGLALIVWAAAVVGAVSLSSSVAHTVHGEQAKAAKTATVLSKPRPTLAPDSVKAADRRSLFVGSNFARTLALVRSHIGPDADVETMEVFPGQLELTVRQPSAEVSVVARIDGEYLSSSDSNVSSSTQAFRLSQIRADVPRSLVVRIASHARVPVGGLNFIGVRIDAIAHRFHWYVYPKRDNIYFQADSARGPIEEFDHGRPGRVIRG